MPYFYYLTHPQVHQDPDVPVPDWGLSELGRARTARFARSDLLANTSNLVSSAERKAIETAEIIAAAIDLRPKIAPATHENDRSATGYLKPEAFERAATAFFNHPDESFRGWETAREAQARIVRQMQVILTAPAKGDILMVGHGGVGTLLYCHLAGHAIDRRHDQPGGGGNLFAYDLAEARIRHGWRPIEAFL